MNYIILVISTLLVAQTLKYLFRLFSKTKNSKNFLWVFVYSTGAPSAHTAILISTLILLNKDIGFSPMFYFSCVISIILIYNLVADRKREIIRESSPRVLDISGHSFFDIVIGVILGLILGIIFINIF